MRPRTGELLTNTLALVGAASLGAFVLGVSSALLISRVRLPFPRLWWLLAALPLAMPSYVFAFAVLAWRPTASGFLPAAVALAVTTTPYVTLPTLAALARADHALADVARTLGRSRLSVLFSVTLPQILPAALAGTLLCALYALSDFAAPALLRYQTLTVGLYSLYTGSLNRSSAAVLALVLVVLAIVVVLIEQRLRHSGRARRAMVSTRVRPPAQLSRVGTTLVAGWLGLVAFVSVILPVGTMLWRARTGSRYAVSPADLATAAGNTLLLGVATAVIAALAALPIAALGARYTARWIRATEAVTFLGQALPGIVIALAMVFLSLRLVPGAYQTLPILLACYVVLFLPKSVGSSRSAIAQVPLAFEDAARTLGRSRLQAWVAITGRRALPGIGAGSLLVMAATMKEVPATLLLRPSELDTLATELWSRTAIGAYNAAAPIALTLVVVGLLPALLLSRSEART